LRPRGLVNNGNMCFMNAILQPLVHCPPFYNFVRGIASEMAHTFNSKTPLLDSMIIFLNEFDEEKPDNPKKFNIYDEEAFAPEYVYDALRDMKKISSTKGRQEDAEEFLGFILDGLHEELLYIEYGSSWKEQAVKSAASANGNGDEWVEVGPKNRAFHSRQTEQLESPITRLFAGQTRSMVRCPGRKDSVTTEPFLALQLDIAPDSVKSIEDAFHNMTRPEVLEGFSSETGNDATRQTLLHHLPPVLILHLKRFLYNSVGGTQKVRKHVTFPTVLRVATDVVTTRLSQRRVAPEYRLLAVVNHHGKFAGGGHYTCDVRRANRPWLRIDDDLVAEVSEEDVTRDNEDRQAYMLFYTRS
ncbi:hypothetical protein HK405_013911, partial [Cladochytrium tenue]